MIPLRCGLAVDFIATPAEFSSLSGCNDVWQCWFPGATPSIAFFASANGAWAQGDTSLLRHFRVPMAWRCRLPPKLCCHCHGVDIFGDLRLALQRLGEVVGHLQAEPHVGGATEGFDQAKGHFGGDTVGAVGEPAQGLAADAEGFGAFGDGEGMRKKVPGTFFRAASPPPAARG